MKKIIFLILISILFIPITAYAAVDVSEKIYDYADLFTEAEEQTLYENITSAINKTNLDIVVVTINDNDKNSAMVYADDFYDYNGFGLNESFDGILLLIDMDTRELWISTTGEAILLFDDNRIDIMLDNIYDYVADGDYYKGALSFVNAIKSYKDDGIPEINDGYYVDSDGNIKRKNSINWPVAIIGALIISGVTIAILISKHKMVVLAKYANDYLDQNNIRMYAPIDTFLTTHTAIVKINHNSGNNGGGIGKIGGSSIHRGSSGRMHGGGGRKF